MLQKKWQEELLADMDEADMDEEQLQLHKEIAQRRKDMVDAHRKTKQRNAGNSVMPRSRVHTKSISNMKDGLQGMGMQAERAVERVRSASAVRTGRKRQRSVAAPCSASRATDAEMADGEGAAKRIHSSRSRSMARGASPLLLFFSCCVCVVSFQCIHEELCYTLSISGCLWNPAKHWKVLAGFAGRSLSMMAPSVKDGVKDVTQKNKALKIADKKQKGRNRQGKAGEGDRVITTKMPKHLFTGKRGIGKTDRR